MTKKVLVPIADGTEEIEAVCIIDVLRRAGAEVVVASVGEKEVTCSRGVKLVADALIGECKTAAFDMIVLPGRTPESAGGFRQPFRGDLRFSGRRAANPRAA